MKFMISMLVTGVDHRDNPFDEAACEISGWEDPDLGVELVAFTHDEPYWQRLVNVLPKLRCPLTFHGPWIGVEVTSAPDSDAGQWLKTAYTNVFDLAAQYAARHVVVHYSQLHFDEKTHATAQQHAYQNLADLLALAEARGVNMVIENLCRAKTGIHLFSNEEYFDLFERFPKAHAIIDVGHANVNGLDVERFLATYGERVTSYHLNNNDGTGDLHWNIFRGTYPIREHMKWVRKYTPDANVVLEYEPHVQLSLSELREQIQELRSF